MKKGVVVFLFSFILNSIVAQHPIGDKLEQLYFQEHYGIVYRKAKKLREKERNEIITCPHVLFCVNYLAKKCKYILAKTKFRSTKSGYFFIKWNEKIQ